MGTFVAKKGSEGNPEACRSRWSVSEASSLKSRRTNAKIAGSAAKELKSLAVYVHMPNVSEVMQERLQYECTT